MQKMDVDGFFSVDNILQQELEADEPVEVADEDEDADDDIKCKNVWVWKLVMLVGVS